MAPPLTTTLARLGLLQAEPPAGAPSLLQLCDAGVLDGGLSVALDVQPDELVGVLLQRLGGAATRLKVLDCRTGPERTLTVDAAGRTETWGVPDVRTLVHHLNRFFHGVAGVRRCAVLGEWEDALQLWCLPKDAVQALKAHATFHPVNAAEL